MNTQDHNTQKTLSGQWINVFRAGTHTDSTGRVVTFTQADLDQIVANHDLGAAPAVIGHPKHNDPAYGWVNEIKREDDQLYVKFRDINPAFEKGIQSGAYRNRSVSICKEGERGYRLRHVGWLGATPPAIDGLTPVSFSDAAADIMEFSLPVSGFVLTIQNIGIIFRKVREWIIAEKGIDEADRVIPSHEIESIENSADSLLTDASREQNHFSNGDKTHMTITQEQLDAEIKAAKEEAKREAAAEFSKQLDEAKQIAIKAEHDRRVERINAQIEKWKENGKVFPAESSGLSEFMVAIDSVSETFEFAAEDGQRSQSLTEWFTDFMAARPARIDLGKKTEQTADPKELSAKDLAAQALEYQSEQARKGLTISISEAMAQVNS